MTNKMSTKPMLKHTHFTCPPPYPPIYAISSPPTPTPVTAIFTHLRPTTHHLEGPHQKIRSPFLWQPAYPTHTLVQPTTSDFRYYTRCERVPRRPNVDLASWEKQTRSWMLSSRTPMLYRCSREGSTVLLIRTWESLVCTSISSLSK
jgi:hypothetical protein